MNTIYFIILVIVAIAFNIWIFRNQFRDKIMLDGIFYAEDKKTKIHIKGEFYGDIINSENEVIKPSDEDLRMLNFLRYLRINECKSVCQQNRMHWKIDGKLLDDKQLIKYLRLNDFRVNQLINQ